METPIIGILWFINESQYQSYRNIFTDSDELPARYATWLSNADKFIHQTELQGKKVVKIKAEVLEFYSWCHRNKINLNAEARRKYAASQVHQLVTAKNGQ